MAGELLPDVFVLNDYSLPNGGSSVVALLSARELARRGCQVTLFTAKGPKPAPESGLRSVCLEQEEIALDPDRVRALTNGLHNRTAASALRRELAQQDRSRTIVHVHTYTKALSSSVISTAIDMGFPVVLTLHDFFMVCPTGGFFRHQQAEICRLRPLSWDCLTCNCDRRHWTHKQWRVARTFLQNDVLKLDRRIRHFVGVSHFSVNVLQRYLPFTAQTTVVRNPVLSQDCGPAPVGESDLFVYIGRFSAEKGPQLFAEAAGNLGVAAAFIGDGELKGTLQQLCPHAIFTGWLSEEEVRAWLRRARALIFPPLWYETLGLVVVEAASAGIPAVVASGCAATEFVRHQETGLLFDHGSVESLTSRLRELRDDTAEVVRLGQTAYEWYWHDPWTVESHVSHLLEVYDQITAAAVS